VAYRVVIVLVLEVRVEVSSEVEVPPIVTGDAKDLNRP
jgi:hypothetical protein